MENTGMAHSRSKGFLAACPIGSATGTIATFLSPSSQLTPTQLTLYVAYFINEEYFPTF